MQAESRQIFVHVESRQIFVHVDSEVTVVYPSGNAQHMVVFSSSAAKEKGGTQLIKCVGS